MTEDDDDPVEVVIVTAVDGVFVGDNHEVRVILDRQSGHSLALHLSPEVVAELEAKLGPVVT